MAVPQSLLSHHQEEQDDEEEEEEEEVNAGENRGERKV